MNRTNTGANTNILQILLDIFIISFSFWVVTLIRVWNFSTEEQIGYLVLGFVFILIYLLANKASYLYNITLFYYMDRMIKKATVAYGTSVISTVFLVPYICPGANAKQFYWCFVCSTYILVLIKTIFSKQIMHFTKKRYARRTAFLGDWDKFENFRSYLQKTSIVFDEVGYIARSNSEYSSNPSRYIGVASELETLIRALHIDQIYIGQNMQDDLNITQKELDTCINMGVTVRLIVDFYNRHDAKSYVSSIGTYPIITYHTIALNAVAEFIKRIMDFIGGLIGVILTSPIMLFTAIAIKLDSPGPVLFKQIRVGKNGRQFLIYKFRSMYLDAEAKKKELEAQNEISGGIMFKIKNDPRITKVGKVIRKLSIDELPQFFNVLNGTMSLVGTRPPTLDEVAKYNTDQWRRISIKPGITGMWQVNGRSKVHDFDEIVRLDVQYIDHWSIWLDIKILLKTVLVLLHHDDAC